MVFRVYTYRMYAINFFLFLNFIAYYIDFDLAYVLNASIKIRSL